MIRIAGQIAMALISCAAIPHAVAPMHLGINDGPYRRSRLIKAIGKWEACPHNNHGCIYDFKRHRYRRYASSYDGWRDLEREMDKRRGMTVKRALESYNAVGTPLYAEKIAATAGLGLGEILP